MSLLPSQSWITPNNPLFLLASISTLTATNIETSNLACFNLSTGQATVSSIKGTEGGVNIDFAFISSINSDGRIEANEFSSIFTYAQEGSVSTLFTQHIVLDQATLDVINGNVLLLNGIPLATTSTSISSLQDWAFFPAIQTVDMNSFGLSNVGNINSQNIFNALNIQSDTFSALTSLTSPSGNITNFRATNLSTNTLQVNTVQNGNNQTNWVSPLAVSSLAVSSLTLSNLSLPVLRAGGLSSLTVSTGALQAGTINNQPYISGSNWAQYPANTTVQLAGNPLNTTGNFSFNANSNTYFNTGGDFSVSADGGIDVANITEIGLLAQNGNRGRINLIANPGFNNGVAGDINLTANGGQVLGVGTGGSINLTANTPLGFSNLTSKISLSASGINSYAGSIPPLASIYGYNFIYGQNGVNICGGLPPALPNVPGTTYIYGTLGVEIPSDAYMANIYPYWNGLTTPPDLLVSGRYIVPNLAQVCVNLSNVRRLDFQSNVATYMSNCDIISMSANGSITTSNLTTTTGSLGTSGFTTLTGTTVNTVNENANTIFASNSVQSPLLSTVSLNLSNMNQGAVRVGQKSLVVVGDVAQIQASNVAGQQGTLNLLMRQNFAEIQSFNSNFTAPLDLRFTANTFGFNIGSQNIQGGYFFDVSGNSIFEYGVVKVGSDLAEGTIISDDHITISTIRQPVIQYGNITTTGGSGSQNVVLPVPYATVGYNIQVSMNDTNPAQLSCVNVDSNNFDIYWANGGGGTHSINWLTAGDLS